jgi:hypothetical protein
MINSLQYDIAIGKEEAERLLSPPLPPQARWGRRTEGQSRLENGGEEGWQWRFEKDKRKHKEDDDPRSFLFKERHLVEAQPMGHGAWRRGPPRPWRGREKRGDTLTSLVSPPGPRT